MNDVSPTHSLSPLFMWSDFCHNISCSSCLQQSCFVKWLCFWAELLLDTVVPKVRTKYRYSYTIIHTPGAVYWYFLLKHVGALNRLLCQFDLPNSPLHHFLWCKLNRHTYRLWRILWAIVAIVFCFLVVWPFPSLWKCLHWNNDTHGHGQGADSVLIQICWCFFWGLSCNVLLLSWAMYRES